jgi:hypothetical protein
MEPPIKFRNIKGFVNKRGSDSKARPATPPAMAMIMSAMPIPMMYHTMDIKRIFTAAPKALPQETTLLTPMLKWSSEYQNLAAGWSGYGL